jgi:hypothetical protein
MADFSVLVPTGQKVVEIIHIHGTLTNHLKLLREGTFLELRN